MDDHQFNDKQMAIKDVRADAFIQKFKVIWIFHEDR